MSTKQEVKKDLAKYKELNFCLKKLIADTSAVAGIYATRHRIDDEQDDARLAEYFDNLCKQLKVVETSFGRGSPMETLLRRRLRQFPSWFSSLFKPKRTRIARRATEPTVAVEGM